jgi:phosphoribosylformylglycinamidine synthase
MAMGERTPLALLDAAGLRRAWRWPRRSPTSPRRRSRELADVKLSANWMAAAGHPGEDAALYEAVRAVGMELCPALGIAIPVGKDSMSMRTRWSEDGRGAAVTAPLSLIVSAFAPVTDVRLTVTPQLRRDAERHRAAADGPRARRNRLGASALAQVYASSATARRISTIPLT